jgi:uncharacterized membrane protein
MTKEKNLELDRLVFFSDAVVAIAITLLALDLKVTPALPDHLTFSDFANAWHKFAAFFLSFFIIAVFWKIHHEFFMYIKKVNATLLWVNLGWLVFIVMLPFTTSMLSSYLFDTAAIFVYCLNVLLVTIFQNIIWDYVSAKRELLSEAATNPVVRDKRIACNLAMVNAVIACVVAFWSPLIAFIILLTRIPIFSLGARYYRQRAIAKSKKLHGKK